MWSMMHVFCYTAVLQRVAFNQSILPTKIMMTAVLKSAALTTPVMVVMPLL